MIYDSTLNDYKKIYSPCTVCLILFVIAFLMNIGISSAYFYFHWYLKINDINIININPKS